MKKQILFTLTIFFVIFFNTQAQYNTCQEASDNALCHNIDGFSSTLPDSNSIGQPPPGNCGITPHNATWCSFVAGTTTIQIDLIAGNCGLTIPGCTAPAGIQAAVYSSCGAPWLGNTVACYGSSILPDSTLSMLLEDLTIGEIYNILLDGNCGSVCDFSFEVISGSTMFNTPLVIDFTVNVNNSIANFINMTTGATDFLWNFGDGDTSTLESPQHLYSQPGNYEVTLTATNECGGVVTLTQTIEIEPEPLVSAIFTTTNNSGCAPVTIEFMDLSSNNPTSWFWEFPGGTPQSSTDQNPIVNYETSGTYEVTFIVANSSSQDTITDSISVLVLYEPEANFSYIIDSSEVSFTNTSNNANTYQWFFGDGNTSTDSNPSHTYTTSGIYDVTLITNNECGVDTITQQIDIIILNVENLLGVEKFNLFPNPNNGAFQLMLEGEAFDILEIKIFNFLGQKLLEEQHDFSSGELNKTFNLQDLNSGAYFLQVRVDESTIYKKIIVE